jgi:hypothetical protein
MHFQAAPVASLIVNNCASSEIVASSMVTRLSPRAPRFKGNFHFEMVTDKDKSVFWTDTEEVGG